MSSPPGQPRKRLHQRLARERLTIAAMLGIYCRAKHGGMDLCAECADLLVYAANRLEHCRYGGGKPPCKDCPAHCYAPKRRAAIQEVMRYAGPRMPARHPYLALRHLLDGLKPAPRKRSR
ncbi:MAG: nitrous oxide-stimulated promoter family protein [Elusimicrobia bacterium]|nr:nitrous oxide-stimulated promoter family protein [Elusimicrobiota bacterium]